MIPLKSGRAVFHSIIIREMLHRARAFIVQGGEKRELAPALKRRTLEIPPRNLCELFFFHHARAKNRNGVGS